MKISSLLPGLSMACGAMLAGLPAGATGTSDIAGIYKIPLSSANGGGNLVSAPFHPKPVFRGKIANIAGNTVTLQGSPRLPVAAFNEVLLGGSYPFAQYIVLLKKDASATPGNAGDWFGVVSNTENQLTLTPGLATPATSFGAGDEIEIRKLTSLKDLFGSGAGCVLNKDSNTDITQAEEDIIRIADGTSFGSQVIYHDGSQADEGYYYEDAHDPDGSKITIGPDEALWVLRKTGSAAANAVTLGRVQTTALTHYLASGANAMGTGFPVDSPVGASNLKESGWVSDVNEDIVKGEDGIINSVVGTSFVDTVFHYAGVNADTGWYLDSELNNDYPLPPAKGLMYFSVGTLIWRQPTPFVP